MKKIPSLRYRRFVFAAMLLAALTYGAMDPLSSLHAQTAASSDKSIVTTPSGLKYVDLVVGTGPAVKAGDHVVVKYLGTLIDGKKFDASADHGDGTFDYIQGVTSLIPGWTEGTSTMKVGGKRKLIIPPYLGYGQQGAGDVIPPNATLIFEIELVAIKPS